MYTPLVTQGPNAVPYWEEPHAVERWAADATEIVRVLTCPWDRRREFIQDLLGWHTRGSGGLLTRVRPDIHPYWSDTSGGQDAVFDAFFAVEANLEAGLGVPLQDDDGLLHYVADPPGRDDYSNAEAGRARYVVTYRPFDYAAFGNADNQSEYQDTDELGRYVSRYRQFGQDVLTLPPAYLEWGQAGSSDKGTGVIPEGAAMPIPYQTILYVWRYVPFKAIPWDIISDTTGKTNAGADFDAAYFGGTGWPENTLLLMQPEIKPVRSPAGQLLFDITYPFQYRPNGHDKLFRFRFSSTQESSWEYVRRKTENDKSIYETATFANLFTPAS